MNAIDFTQPVFFLGSRPIDLGTVLVGLAVAMSLLVLLAGFAIDRAGRDRARAEAEAEAVSEALEARVAELLRAQSETSGRLQAMTEILGERQAELTRALSDRLDGMGHRIGQSMAETTRSTHESLRTLGERLVKIDEARETIVTLSGHVVALERIFSDKQTRGAFGQGRMEAIVADALPASAFSFQATLSTGTRPDCLVHLPNGQPSLVIDAKFPLEAWNRLNVAETPEAIKAAETQFRRDVTKHVDDIRGRYFVPGETQDTAFLFVPSESLFASIHERFEDIVAKAGRGRVVLVSPSLLLLSIQLVQALLRDEKMREQAHVIQNEVRKLLEDVGRLNDRVLKLQGHFAQVNNDVETIVVSTGKIQKRGARIDSLDLEEPATETRPAIVRSVGQDSAA